MAGRRLGAPSLDPSPPQVQIPKQTLDPSWSLKPMPAVLTVGGVDYEIPAVSAAEWLAVLMDNPPDLDELVRTLVDGGQELLFDERVGEELYDALLDLITLVSGRPWWQAMRLIWLAVDNWNVLGAEMMYRGFLPQQVSLSAWLDVLLLVTMRNIEPKEAAMFVMRLEMPPPELVDEAVEAIPDMDRNAFLALGS